MAETITELTAAESAGRPVDPLHAIAIECVRDPASLLLPLVPGLADDAYEHDGALTKRHVRAATLAALAPTPGALLWDIGAGSGSIAIEWLRSEPTARAIAVEPRDDRVERISANALQLGVGRDRCPGVLRPTDPAATPAVIATISSTVHRTSTAKRLLRIPSTVPGRHTG